MAELTAVVLARKHVYCSEEKLFLTGSDLLSSLQTMYNLKYDHPVLVQILELYMELTTNGKEIFLSGFLAMWALEEIWLQTQTWTLLLRMP